MSAATRTVRRQVPVTRDFVPESFVSFAHNELMAAPNWQFGICANPLCSRDFNPTRDSQKFCCEACERTNVSEMRRWGHRLAPALLIARETKYALPGTVEAELRRAARSYLTQGSTLWLQERRSAISKAKEVR